jgi:RNA polymerase sigma-70 factor (ECF subfamily)
MTADERELIRKFCDGDVGAYDAVYAGYGERIYRFCHRLCDNAADAEDLTQEVFLAAFQGRRSFQGRASLNTWLYRIARYRWHARLSDSDNRHVALPDAETGGELTVDPIPSALDRMTLDRAISTLPVALRETFLLVKAEGLTCREAAVVLEIPTGTVKYRIHEATGRLRTLLAPEAGRAPSKTQKVPLVREVVNEM